MGNHPLTSSDRAEIFTKDTLKYLPEVESAVLISDVSVESEIFEKAQNYL